MTETEGARQRKGKEGEQGPERKDQPAASKEIKKEEKKEEKKKEKGSSLCAVLFFLLLILAGVLGYYVHKQNEKFNLPEFKKVKKVTTGITEDVKGEMLEKRHPRLFTHAISPNILTLSSFVGNFSHIKLSKAQRSTTGIFAPFDSESPLADARYLATTGSVDDVIDLQAGEFWKDPLSANGLYYFYEAQTYRDFRAYAQNLPADFPLEKQGSSSPRVMFATQGSRTKPYNYHSNTYLAVLDGAIDVVLFPPSESHDLYPYPEYHPNFGSGQVLYQENYPLADRVEILLKYPRILKAKGVKTSASAGDILYIPPFWFAQVTFKKPSILLKTFSPMYESEVLHELLHLEVPHSDNLDTQIFVVKKLIDWFVPPSLGVSSTQFIKDLVNARYLPLYKDLSVETTTDFTPCHQEDPETEKEVREFSEMTLKSIKKFSTALEDMKRVRLIVMEQYVEHLIQKTISAEDAYNFYLNCFPLGLDNSRSTAQDIE